MATFKFSAIDLEKDNRDVLVKYLAESEKILEQCNKLYNLLFELFTQTKEKKVDTKIADKVNPRDILLMLSNLFESTIEAIKNQLVEDKFIGLFDTQDNTIAEYIYNALVMVGEDRDGEAEFLETCKGHFMQLLGKLFYDHDDNYIVPANKDIVKYVTTKELKCEFKSYGSSLQLEITDNNTTVTNTTSNEVVFTYAVGKNDIGKIVYDQVAGFITKLVEGNDGIEENFVDDLVSTSLPIFLSITAYLRAIEQIHNTLSTFDEAFKKTSLRFIKPVKDAGDLDIDGTIENTGYSVCKAISNMLSSVAYAESVYEPNGHTHTYSGFDVSKLVTEDIEHHHAQLDHWTGDVAAELIEINAPKVKAFVSRTIFCSRSNHCSIHTQRLS